MAITIHPEAADRVHELCRDELGSGDLFLRVFITGGGCSGFQYGFSFEEEAADDDYRFEQEGWCLLVDPISHTYLNSASINFRDNLLGSQFVIDNPNAVTSCGCGASFSV